MLGIKNTTESNILSSQLNEVLETEQKNSGSLSSVNNRPIMPNSFNGKKRGEENLSLNLISAQNTHQNHVVRADEKISGNEGEIKETVDRVTSNETIHEILNAGFNERLPNWMEYYKQGFNKKKCVLDMNQLDNLVNFQAAQKDETIEHTEVLIKDALDEKITLTKNKLFQAAGLLASTLKKEFNDNELSNYSDDELLAYTQQQMVQTNYTSINVEPSIYKIKNKFEKLFGILSESSNAINKYQLLLKFIKQDKFKESENYKQVVEQLVEEVWSLLSTQKIFDNPEKEKKEIMEEITNLLNNSEKIALNNKIDQLIEGIKKIFTDELELFTNRLTSSAKFYLHFSKKIKSGKSNQRYHNIAATLEIVSTRLQEVAETFFEIKKEIDQKKVKQTEGGLKNTISNVCIKTANTICEAGVITKNMIPSFKEAGVCIKEGMKEENKQYTVLFRTANKHGARGVIRLKRGAKKIKATVNKKKADVFRQYILSGKKEFSLLKKKNANINESNSDKVNTISIDVTNDQKDQIYNAQFQKMALPILVSVDKLLSGATLLKTTIKTARQQDMYFKVRQPETSKLKLMRTEKQPVQKKIELTVEDALHEVLDGLIKNKTPQDIILAGLQEEKKEVMAQLVTAKKIVLQALDAVEKSALQQTLDNDLDDIHKKTPANLQHETDTNNVSCSFFKNAIKRLQRQAEIIDDIVKSISNGRVPDENVFHSISNVKKNLAGLKEEIKKTVLNQTGEVLDNYSREGMLARAIAEWVIEQKQSVQNKAGDMTLFDNVVEEFINQNVCHAFYKKNDPYAGLFARRVRLAIRDAENNRKLWRLTAADILKQGKDSKEYLMSYGEKRLFFWLMLGAVGGEDVWLRAVSTSFRSNLWFPHLRYVSFMLTPLHLMNLFHKVKNSIKPGEDLPHYAIEKRVNQEVFKFLFRLSMFLVPPVVSNILGASLTLYGLYQGGKFRDKFIYRILERTPMNGIWTAESETVEEIISAVKAYQQALQAEYFNQKSEDLQALLHKLLTRIGDSNKKLPLGLNSLGSLASDLEAAGTQENGSKPVQDNHRTELTSGVQYGLADEMQSTSLGPRIKREYLHEIPNDDRMEESETDGDDNGATNEKVDEGDTLLVVEPTEEEKLIVNNYTSLNSPARKILEGFYFSRDVVINNSDLENALIASNDNVKGITDFIEFIDSKLNPLPSEIIESDRVLFIQQMNAVRKGLVNLLIRHINEEERYNDFNYENFQQQMRQKGIEIDLLNKEELREDLSKRYVSCIMPNINDSVGQHDENSGDYHSQPSLVDEASILFNWEIIFNKIERKLESYERFNSLLTIKDIKKLNALKRYYNFLQNEQASIKLNNNDSTEKEEFSRKLSLLEITVDKEVELLEVLKDYSDRNIDETIKSTSYPDVKKRLETYISQYKENNSLWNQLNIKGIGLTNVEKNLEILKYKLKYLEENFGNGDAPVSLIINKEREEAEQYRKYVSNNYAVYDFLKQKNALRTSDSFSAISKETLIMSAVNYLVNNQNEKNVFAKALLSAADLYGSKYNEELSDKQYDKIINQWLFSATLGMQPEHYIREALNNKLIPHHQIVNTLKYPYCYDNQASYNLIRFSVLDNVSRKNFGALWKKAIESEIPCLSLINVNDEHEKKMFRLDNYEFASLYTGAKLLNNCGVDLNTLSKNDVLKIGNAFWLKAKKEGVTIDMLTYLYAPALFSSKANSETRLHEDNLSGKVMLTTQYIEQYAKYAPLAHYINDTINDFKTSQRNWLSRRKLAEAIIDSHKIGNLSINIPMDPIIYNTDEKRRSAFIDAYLNGAVVKVNNKPLESVDTIYENNTAKVADAYAKLDELFLHKVFTSIPNKEQSFIFSTQAKIEVGRTRFNDPLVLLRAHNCKDYSLLKDAYLIQVTVGKESRIYSLKRTDGSYSLTRVDTLFPIPYLVQCKVEGSSKFLVTEFDTVVKNENDKPDKLIEYFKNRHKKEFYDHLYQKGWDPTIMERIWDVSKHLIPFYDCIEESKEGKALKATFDCAMSIVLFIIPAYEAGALSVRFSESLIEALEAGTAASRVGAGATAALSEGLSRIALPGLEELSSVGVNILRAFDPGIELAASLGRNSLKGLIALIKESKSGEALSHVIEKLEERFAKMEEISAKVSEGIISARLPDSEIEIPVKKINNINGKDIYVHINPSSGELSGCRYIIENNKLILLSDLPTSLTFSSSLQNLKNDDIYVKNIEESQLSLPDANGVRRDDKGNCFINVDDKLIAIRHNEKLDTFEVFNNALPDKPGYPIRLNANNQWEFGLVRKMSPVSDSLSQKIPVSSFKTEVDASRLLPEDSRGVVKTQDGQEYLKIDDRYVKIVRNPFLTTLYRIKWDESPGLVCLFNKETYQFNTLEEYQHTELAKPYNMMRENTQHDPVPSTSGQSEIDQSASGAVSIERQLDLSKPDINDNVTFLRWDENITPYRQMLQNNTINEYFWPEPHPTAFRELPPCRLKTDAAVNASVHLHLNAQAGDDNYQFYHFETGGQNQDERINFLTTRLKEDLNQLSTIYDTLLKAFENEESKRIIWNTLSNILQTTDKNIMDNAMTLIRRSIKSLKAFHERFAAKGFSNIFFYSLKDETKAKDMSAYMSMHGFTIMHDPNGRIYINVEAAYKDFRNQSPDKPVNSGTYVVLHESTHQSLYTQDYAYAQSIYNNFETAETFITRFKQSMLNGDADQSLYQDVIGKNLYSRMRGNASNLEDAERNTAIDLLRGSEMRLNDFALKNADSIAIVLHDLYSAIKERSRVRRSAEDSPSSDTSSSNQRADMLQMLSMFLAMNNMPVYRPNAV